MLQGDAERVEPHQPADYRNRDSLSERVRNLGLTDADLDHVMDTWVGHRYGYVTRPARREALSTVIAAEMRASGTGASFTGRAKPG